MEICMHKIDRRKKIVRNKIAKIPLLKPDAINSLWKGDKEGKEKKTKISKIDIGNLRNAFFMSK